MIREEMRRSAPAILALVVVVILGTVLAPAPSALAGVARQDAATEDHAAEVARVQKLADELLPKVSKATGLPIKHPVKVNVITKKEVQEYMLKLLDLEYPGDQMARQSEALAMLGLLPADYDLRTALVDLMTEQAAAFYDPRTKVYNGISDLAPMMKNPMMEQTIAAHELTHALQDQAVDLLPLQQKFKDDSDRAYALSAVMEGMASVIMTTAINGAKIEAMPDLGKMMRASMTMMADSPEMKVLASSPEYLRETLVSPYAEGASFVQDWAKKNPGHPVAELFKRLPSSAEQILHIDKYLGDDKPHAIDLGGAVAALPAGWEEYFHNTLGEFDVRIMCDENAATKPEAVKVGEGWDGLAFATCHNGDRKLILGTSCWDSETDAAEFAEAFNIVLSGVHGDTNAHIRRRGVRVSFVAGMLQDLAVSDILDRLDAAPAVEED